MRQTRTCADRRRRRRPCEELRHQLAVWLGGRAAEELVFHETSTGAHNDLHATEVARAMVAQYGMSDAIGPIAVETRTPSPLFPLGTVDARNRVAEETAREVDSRSSG